MTANGTPRDRSAALAAGADYFLPKPFSPAEISKLVEILLRKPSATIAEPQGSEQQHRVAE